MQSCKALEYRCTDMKIVSKIFCTYLKLQDVSLQRFSLFLSRSLCRAVYVGSDRRDLSPCVCVCVWLCCLPRKSLAFFFFSFFFFAGLKTYYKSRGSYLSTQTAATAAAEGTKFHCKERNRRQAIGRPISTCYLLIKTTSHDDTYKSEPETRWTGQ